MSAVSPLLQFCVVAVVASVVCDVVHALLHVASHQQHRALRFIASLHQTHHDFLDRSLSFHDEGLGRNLLCHQLPELLMRSAVTCVVGAVFDAEFAVKGALVVICVVDCAVVVARRGRDAFHTSTRPLSPPRSRLLVDDRYHALHHAFPDHFLSAHLPLLDVVAGRLLPLRGRRVVIVGASAWCHSLFAALQPITDTLLVRASELRAADFAGADLVVLGHGADVRGDTSYEALLATLQGQQRRRLLPLEVWTVGDDPAWRARWQLLVDERTVLRQVHHGTRFDARVALFFFARGARWF